MKGTVYIIIIKDAINWMINNRYFPSNYFDLDDDVVFHNGKLV